MLSKFNLVNLSHFERDSYEKSSKHMNKSEVVVLMVGGAFTTVFSGIALTIFILLQLLMLHGL